MDLGQGLALELHKIKTENTYLGYHADIHIAPTTQVIEDTRAYGFRHKLYSLFPLEYIKEFNIKLL
jgi:hypothetical protein